MIGQVSDPDDRLLTPSEVAAMFRVDPKTVTRWATAGKLASIRTLGGHRRYRAGEVRMLLAGVPAQRPAPKSAPPAEATPVASMQADSSGG